MSEASWSPLYQKYLLEKLNTTFVTYYLVKYYPGSVVCQEKGVAKAINSNQFSLKLLKMLIRYSVLHEIC